MGSSDILGSTAITGTGNLSGIPDPAHRNLVTGIPGAIRIGHGPEGHYALSRRVTTSRRQCWNDEIDRTSALRRHVAQGATGRGQGRCIGPVVQKRGVVLQDIRQMHVVSRRTAEVGNRHRVLHRAARSHTGRRLRLVDIEFVDDGHIRTTRLTDDPWYGTDFHRPLRDGIGKRQRIVIARRAGVSNAQGTAGTSRNTVTTSLDTATRRVGESICATTGINDSGRCQPAGTDPAVIDTCLIELRDRQCSCATVAQGDNEGTRLIARHTCRVSSFGYSQRRADGDISRRRIAWLQLLIAAETRLQQCIRLIDQFIRAVGLVRTNGHCDHAGLPDSDGNAANRHLGAISLG